MENGMCNFTQESYVTGDLDEDNSAAEIRIEEFLTNTAIDI
jgi:hypothetical protein